MYPSPSHYGGGARGGQHQQAYGTHQQQHQPQQQQPQQQQQQQPTSTLFIAGIDERFTDDALASIFTQYGCALGAPPSPSPPPPSQHPTPPRTPTHRFCPSRISRQGSKAWVAFASAEDARSAIASLSGYSDPMVQTGPLKVWHQCDDAPPPQH